LTEPDEEEDAAAPVEEVEDAIGNPKASNPAAAVEV
jgi:hypothetical protein